MTIGLTGGIATGKSSVLKALGLLPGINTFSADEVVHDLYSKPHVISQVLNVFGAEVFSEGQLSRVKIREQFLSDPNAKSSLEGIMHPLVRNEYESAVASIKPGCHLVAEIPLLFETGVSYDFDKVIVVALSENQQLLRLKERSGLDTNEAKEMISKQVALSVKIDKADHILWNEGSLDQLQRQIDILVHHIF